MIIGVVTPDLMIYSRIASAAGASGHELVRVDGPGGLPPRADLVLVDWSERTPAWADQLRSVSAERVILFGPHTDLRAHEDARAADLGPMWARSRLMRALPALLRP